MSRTLLPLPALMLHPASHSPRYVPGPAPAPVCDQGSLKERHVVSLCAHVCSVAQMVSGMDGKFEESFSTVNPGEG